MRNWQEEDRRALRERLREAHRHLGEIGKRSAKQGREIRRLRDAIGALANKVVNDDAWALTFQTYGQLRTAIGRALAEIAKEGE